MNPAGVVERLTWPRMRVGTALSRIAEILRPRAVPLTLADPDPDLEGPKASPAVALERWVEAGARRLLLGLEPIDARATTLADLGPPAAGTAALVWLPDVEGMAGPALLLLGTRRGLCALARDGRVTLLTADELDILDRRLFGAAPELDAIAAVRREARGQRLRWALRRRGRMPASPARGWVVSPEDQGFWSRVRAAGLVRAALRGCTAYVAQIACFAAAIWLVGKSALDGHLETVWVGAFALLLLTMVALRGWASSTLGRVSLGIAGLARERLLEGIFRLDGDEVRSRGVGQFLGMVMEIDALEALARGGGLLALAASFDFGLGLIVLALGAAPWPQFFVLAACVAVFALRMWRYRRRLWAWTEARLQLSYDLVENMNGHRTLVAQGDESIRQQQDDHALASYDERGAALDAEMAFLPSVLPRAWVLLGLLALAPAFVRGTAGGSALAVSLAGLLLVRGAFAKLSEAAPALSAALVAWSRTRPLFEAAARPRGTGAEFLATAPDENAVGRRGLLIGRELMFRYANRPEPVLRGAAFSIRRGDRVLIEGGSGSGKSTLGSLLVGLQRPSSGVLLLGGFDHHSLGAERWRQRSSGVPQFHENHVLASSLLFNLLLGRGWPPRREDLVDAEVVCRELGLDAVIARMPAGLQQMVGDSGWQLSHGEKSRLFIARSLLQTVDVRVLDESLGALDPETMEQVLACVLRRAETLVVIAHT